MDPKANENLSDKDIIELALARQTDELTDDEFHRLEELLASDDEALSTYIEHVGDSIAISKLVQRFDGELLPLDIPTATTKESHSWFHNPGFLAACAATLLVALFVSNQMRDDKSFAATLTSDVNCEWASHLQTPRKGQPIAAGQVIQFESGLAEIEFADGAIVTLQGPVQFVVKSAGSGDLISGKLSAFVPEQAIGFRVKTPTADVLDLGTEFGLSVDGQGATDMVVFSGKIISEYEIVSADASDPFEELPAEQAAEFASVPLPRGSRLLTEGKGMRITHNGVIERIVSIKASDYPFTSDYSNAPNKQPNVIVAVSDNLHDTETEKYYQIVHGGFGEDKRAFVGRRFEWNGITQEHGLPQVLRNADYIKTFCDDTVNDHIEIKVQLSQAARLFVLIDNRLELPAWLEEEFEDTGYDVGLDENSRTNRTWQRLKRGPGLSLDTACSVWFKDVLEPGTVGLGSLVPPCKKKRMYGIAAVPLTVARAIPEEPVAHHEPRFGLKLLRKDHLPAPLAETKIEISGNQFDRLTLASPAKDDAAAYSNGMRFRPQTLGGAIKPERAVKIIDGAMPALNDGLVSRNNTDVERNVFYESHGRFTLDFGRSVKIQSINCFSWHRRYRGRQFFTVWGSNVEEMPAVDFEKDEQAKGWDYIGLAYTRDHKKYDTIHTTSLQPKNGSLGPYRHLLWITEYPTFFTEIDVHEVE